MFSRLSKHERFWIWTLAALGAVSRLLLAFRSPARLATRPYIEDAFYAFSVARHLALGHGFTVDGQHPTNGVQPLICLLYAPFFAISNDRWSALALTFILQAIIQVLSTLVLVALVSRLTEGESTVGRKFTPVVFAAFIWNVSMQLLVHNSNGLETGLVALLLVSITYVLSFDLTWTRTLVAGILLGLVVLARIDTAVYVAAVCLWILVRRHAPARAVTAGAVAVLISLPWWLYSYRTFGSMMPISGQSETAHALQANTILSNVWESLIALSDIVSVFFYHQRNAVPEWVNALWIVAVAMAAIYIVRRVRPFRLLTRTSALQPLVWFSAFALVYYTVFFGAPHFLARYLHPIRLVWILLVAVAIPDAFRSNREHPPRALRAAGYLVAIAIVGFTAERYLNNFTTSKISDLYTAGVWATEHPDLRVGMEQSGTSGFTADNVLNLDGKVNAGALHALKAGSDSLGRYVARHVDVLADWPGLLAPTLRAAAQAGTPFQPIDTLGDVVIYRAVDLRTMH